MNLNSIWRVIEAEVEWEPRRQIRNNVSELVRANIWAAIDNPVWNMVSDQVRIPVFDQLAEQKDR